jgi:hypothetical protein
MDPVTALTAGAIAQLAFNEFVKAGVGEAAKKLTGEAIAKAQELRKAIWAKFQGNDRAESALTAVEEQGTSEALEKVSKLLDAEMVLEPEFAKTVQQMAQQVINIQNQTADVANRIYKQTAGRDIFNIEEAGQNNKFGGS